MEDANVLLERVLTWARNDERVSAVLETGSRARGARVDAYSDLDLEVIAPRWRELVNDQSWVDVVGVPLVGLTFDPAEDDSGDPWFHRLVVYAEGRKVDFTVAGERRLTEMIASGLDDTYRRGFVVHFDRTGLAAALPPVSGVTPSPALPARHQFDRTVEEFWFEASQVPIYLARNDLWVVKMRDNTMKQMLLRILQWLAVSDPTGPQDVWHIGHHMDEWLPPAVWSRVHNSFGRFDAVDSWRALRETTTVFSDVSGTVALRLGFPARTALAAGVLRLIDQIAAGCE